MKRKSVFLLIGIIITACSLYLALRNVNFAATGQALQKAQFEYALPFLLSLLCFYVLKAVRWHQLLRVQGSGPSARSLAGPMMVGFAANNLLPLRIGELARIFVATRVTGVPTGTILASIALERLLDVVAILVLAAAATWFDSQQELQHPLIPYLGLAAIAAAALLFVTAFGSKFLFGKYYELEANFPEAIRKVLGNKVHKIESGFRAIRNTRQLFVVLANSFLQWALLGLAILISCKALGVAIPVSAAIILMLLITVAISVPSTPGFIGVIEYSFVLGLGAFGVGPDMAVAVAIFYHVLTWISVTLTGTYYINRYSMSWSDLKSQSAADDISKLT